jgi:DNA-binding protein
LPKRAVKPKTAKEAATKPRRKSKPSKPKVESPTQQATQTEITQPIPEAVESSPEPVVAKAEALEVRPEEVKQQLALEEAPTARPEPPTEEPLVAEPAPPAAPVVEAPPAPQFVPTTPFEPSSIEAEVEEGETSPAEELPPRRDVPPNHMFIGKKPVMGYALSAVMQLTQYEEVVLRARGKAISRAVDVAEVIKHRLGNGQFVARYIKIDTDIVGEGAERRNISTIEIGVGKKA